jgi:dihydrofolate synthase / folylpolyglutamate synthase
LNYTEAMQFLSSAMRFGSRLGLERMQEMMEELHHPGMDIPCIHVAGTNGKGSTSVMIANILAAAGHKIGLYTSPYLERFSERIRVIDGREGLIRQEHNEATGEIPDNALANCVLQVKKTTDHLIERGLEHPTEFELVTAAAFLYFQMESCDILVLETGLGGRLDSTNVVKRPVACVITAIGYDHMDRLGDTIGQIASEKAGIIKPGSQVFALDPYDYAKKPDAEIIRKVLEKTAYEQGVKSLTFIGRDIIKIEQTDINGQTFTYSPDHTRHVRMHTSLLGTHQTLNAALAISVCREKVSTEDIVFGIARTIWPGRLERIREKNPCILLDGAHNEQGVAALGESLARLFPNERIVFLIGVMKDKEYRKMIEQILKDSRYQSKAVFCTRPKNERALNASELAQITQEILDNLPGNVYNHKPEVYFDEEVEVAVNRAMCAALIADAVLVMFGSLYMAGIIRAHIRKSNIVCNEI